MRSFLMISLGLFLFSNIHSQDKTGTKVSGKVQDAGTRKPVEYASITLSGPHFKNTAVSDAKGYFELSGIPAGSYSVIIDFIGYARSTDTVLVNGKPVNLHTILLQPAGQNLTAVTVTSKPPIVENKIDKIVYNAANDITSQGGVATDVLKKVPQVTVDIDGNVELQGNSSIRFLINGKPSSLFGSSIADALASIPASQIKSIEAITSPGAKYDAQGTGGIINIILKDSKVQGMNGSINLSAGTRLENASVNFNIRHGNFGINAFFSGNAQLQSHTPSNQNRLSYDTTMKTSTTLSQIGYTDLDRQGYQSGIGFDWSLTKKESLTGGISFNHNNNHNNGVTVQDQSTLSNAGAILSDLKTERTADSRSGTNDIDVNLDYKKKFKRDGEELELLYSGGFNNPNSYYLQTQNYAGQLTPYRGATSNNPGTERETNISVDYTYPASEHLVIETGLKTVLENIYSDAGVMAYNASNGKYINDTAQSYRLNYDRQVYAAYISGTGSIGKGLNVKAGLRFEHTDTRIDFPGTVIPPYDSWVPSVIFSHEFKNKETIKLAYSHRIERPDYREINPFKNLSDPYNISTGNPLLQPELGDNFELGFNKVFETGGSIYISFVSRFNSHDIKPYTLFYPTYKIGDSTYTNVSVSTRQNIGTENRTGISISGSVPFGKLNLRTNIFISNRHINNALNGGAITDGLDGRMNINATYTLPKNLILEAFFNYNTAVNNIQGKQPQFFAYTFAFRKFFLNKKASLGITATNPFSYYINQLTTVTTQNYTSTTTRQVPYQSFGISLSYKFGKLEFKKQKEEDNNFINNPPAAGN